MEWGLLYKVRWNAVCVERCPHGVGQGKRPRIFSEPEPYLSTWKIPRFEKLIATIRSREISACVVLQAQSQLKAIYKDSAETITGNMDSRIFLGGAEKTTLDDLVKALGRETFDHLTHSVTKGNSPSFGQNWQKLGKELMSFDELAVMDGSKCILQLRGVRPFLSDKYDITKHKNYKYLSDSDPKNAFDVDKYLSTQIKVAPDDEYEFYEFGPDDEFLDPDPVLTA